MKPKKADIKFGEGNTMNTMVLLIPFNCIFDTDVGLIKVIKYSYFDTSVFKQNVLDSIVTNKDIVEFVYNCPYNNILQSILINNDKEEADEYYKQFMEAEYSNILANSVFTGVLDLLNRLEDEPDIKFTICCMKHEEVDFIKSIIPDDNLEIKLLRDIIPKINMYKQFFFKSVVSDEYFEYLFRFLSSNTIYLLDYYRNFEENGDLKDSEEFAVAEDVRRNRTSIINAFDNQTIKRKEFVSDGRS